MAEQSSRRLASWKEIAGYVGRDARTVARWEKERGFPVRRLPGGPRSSVFAYTDEIDVWMRGAEAAAATRVHTSRRIAYWFGAAVIAGSVALLTARYGWATRSVITDLRVEASQLVALSGDVRVWSHDFGVPVHFAPIPQQYEIDDLDGDRVPETLAAMHMRSSGLDVARLVCLDAAGEPRWQQTLEQSVVYGGETYSGPWGSGPVIVQHATGGTRVVWATHHYTWWPAVIAMMDERGHVRARFMHPGWITAMRSLPSDRVLIAGVNNEFNSDIVAVLDDGSWPGAAPPATAPPFVCRDCPDGRPLRYFVVPRTELNALVDAPRQQAHIHAVERGVTLRTYQNGTDPGGGELILEFAADMTPVRARMSDAYWTWHRELERAGRVRHSAEACPDRRGIELREWQRDRGWTRRYIPSAASY